MKKKCVLRKISSTFFIIHRIIIFYFVWLNYRGENNERKITSFCKTITSCYIMSVHKFSSLWRVICITQMKFNIFEVAYLSFCALPTQVFGYTKYFLDFLSLKNLTFDCLFRLGQYNWLVQWYFSIFVTINAYIWLPLVLVFCLNIQYEKVWWSYTFQTYEKYSKNAIESENLP